MLHLGGKAATPEAGAMLSAELLANGSAYKHFLQMVALQTTGSAGDPPSPNSPYLAAFADPAAFHTPAARRTLPAPRGGFLSGMDCTRIGWAVQRLGAGRARPGDPVSAHAGIEMHAKLGDRLTAGQPLVTLFAEDAALLDEPEAMLRETLQIADAPPEPIPLVREFIRQEIVRH